ncbi:glutathione S-transferase-like [Arctopsyche grandis]|uniref:glutathione S-transferase-like n=1 Tax=Arctopsyche grandis TaxID=121162 RepID=UPI00406DA4C6
MSPKYKLTYFDIKGLGECIKYIFAYKGIEYECETVILFTGKGPWNDIKASTPFGQLPVLEVDGKRLYQSQAICQYLANQHDLLTGNAWDDAHNVALASAMQDLIIRVARCYYERNLEMKATLMKDREDNMLPFYYKRFEDILKSRGDFYAGKVSWIDFYMVAGIEAVDGMMGADNVSGKFPFLKSHMERVWNLPKVKEYIANRPPYPR